MKQQYKTNICGVEFVLTCEACPEQYDAFLAGTQIGYLRLRHGAFRVDYPSSGGETIFFAEPEGDGAFDDYERERYLTIAAQALLERHIVGGAE